jgi:aryl-alcohol dehydrogenase-like predicted oxidoreductase
MITLEYAHLGRSGLLVSRLGIGTYSFGSVASEAESFAVMDRAHEHGINLIDTSNVYGFEIGTERVENIVGRWLTQGGGRRERTILATKVYGKQSDWPNDSHLSALHIRRACDLSLQRLQTDHIDLYQMHHIDRDTPFDEIWEAMGVLRAQGKILYVGSSNFAGWHIAQAQETATARHFLGLVSEQSLYNLVTRDIEREVIPAAQAYGVAVLPWSPLGRGMLAGILAKESQGGLHGNRVKADALEQYRPQLERYEALCRKLAVPPEQVALAWLLSRPGITSPIVGPVTPDQLDGAVQALDLGLEDAVRAELDDIFPGFRTAPEDYAW